MDRKYNETAEVYQMFCSALNRILEPVQDKNIIVYGSRGGDFIRWYLKQYYDKDVKAIVDRWDLSPVSTILHLWSFYYIYNENDVIINTKPVDIKEEFNDTGEDWKKVKYRDDQIINLWHILYDFNGLEKNNQDTPEITYYDWIENKYDIDLLTTIKRKHTSGKHAHGYMATDFRVFMEGISKCEIGEKDAVLDIGCGKGSGVIALLSCGFKNIGAIEYTKEIYEVMRMNFQKLNISYQECDIKENTEKPIEGVNCYLGDASLLNKQLNSYNWFFMFNPFSLEMLQLVLNNICNSIKNKPRKVYIFYAEPIGHNLIMETGMFRIKEKVCGDFSDMSYYSYIYESVGRGEENE